MTLDKQLRALQQQRDFAIRQSMDNWQQIRSAAREAMSPARLIRKHPWAMGAAAGAAGFLLARQTGSQKRSRVLQAILATLGHEAHLASILRIMGENPAPSVENATTENGQKQEKPPSLLAIFLPLAIRVVTAIERRGNMRHEINANKRRADASELI